MGQSGIIMVIDMTKAFLEPGHPLYCGDTARAIIPHVVKLLMEHNDMPRLFISDYHRPDDPEFRMFPPHSVAGTEETEAVDQLKPFEGAVIHKSTFSSFYNTSLEKRLSELNPSLVTVAGVCTDICVLYAVMDLRTRGYKVKVPAACVASFDAEGHKWALKHMEKVLGAQVLME